PVDARLDRVRQAPVDDNPAQWNGSTRALLPELSKIDDLLQPLLLVGETILVNDRARVEFVAQKRALDVGEHQCGLVARLRKRETEEKIRRRQPAGNRNSQRAA